MKTRILGLAVLVALAGCAETTDQPITEEIFVSSPASAPPTEVITDTLTVETGPDGRVVDPALALVEEDPDGGTDGLTERLPDTCKLEDYQQYRGMTVAEIDAAGLSVSYRIVGPTDIVTQEYNPMRVNFYTGRDGRISQIACG